MSIIQEILTGKSCIKIQYEQKRKERKGFKYNF